MELFRIIRTKSISTSISLCFVLLNNSCSFYIKNQNEPNDKNEITNKDVSEELDCQNEPDSLDNQDETADQDVLEEIDYQNEPDSLDNQDETADQDVSEEIDYQNEPDSLDNQDETADQDVSEEIDCQNEPDSLDNQDETEVFYLPTKIKEKKSQKDESDFIKPKLSNDEIKIRFFGEFIFLKAMEDGLRYADTNSYNLYPYGKAINQTFSYKPGFRVGADFPLNYDKLKFGAVFTRYHANPKELLCKDPNQFLFACLTFPNYLPYGNSQCGYVRGNWHCDLDYLDAEIKKSLNFGRSLLIDPVFGIRGVILNQRVDVKYKDYLITDSSFTVAQRVIGKSNVWGAGTFIGAYSKILFPRNISFLFNWKASFICGSFTTTTKYTDFATPSSELTSSFAREQLNRLFTIIQLQSGLSKKWIIKNNTSVDFSLGWETQVWSEQMRMTWFSTITSPKEGNLVFYGPFANLSLCF